MVKRAACVDGITSPCSATDFSDFSVDLLITKFHGISES